MPQFVAERGVQITARGSKKNSLNVQIESFDFYQGYQCYPPTKRLDIKVPFLQQADRVYNAAQENLTVYPLIGKPLILCIFYYSKMM